MRSSHVLPLLLLSSFASTAAYSSTADGPFGIAAGADPAALGCELADAGRGLWRCPHPPSPQPGYTEYAVLSSWTSGVCHVLASTDTIPNDRAGFATRSRAQTEAQQLAREYGPWRAHVDTRETAPAQARVSDQWMAQLQHEAQTYSYSWLSAEMPNGVVMIVLKAAALDDRTGRITVEFFLANSACASEHDRRSGKTI